MEKSGFRSAERCLRSLSRQIPAIATKTLAEDTIFIGKSDRLLVSHTNEPSLSDFYKRKRRGNGELTAKGRE